MPKTYGNLWEKISLWENLYRSYLKARKGHKLNPEILRFQADLEVNLTNIHNHLLYKSWRPGPWRQFWVYDPKSRLIQAPPFQDRVVHHALVDVIEPFFERKMIYDSYACRRGKGTHGAVNRLQDMLRRAGRHWSKTYVLKADISKYFPSVNHDLLLEILSKTIRDKGALWLCDQIIRQGGFTHRGIPVGALTSQLFANVYLDRLDHRVKDEWGIKHYVRYMDDFVILGGSKAELWNLLDNIEEFLACDLRLSLNPKTCIYPAVKGVDFAGYRTWATHVLPRKRNIKRARRQFRALARAYAAGRVGLSYIKPRLMSFLGYVKYCRAGKTTDSVLSELALSCPGRARP